jgi:hypothetical protein
MVFKPCSQESKWRASDHLGHLLARTLAKGGSSNWKKRSGEIFFVRFAKIIAKAQVRLVGGVVKAAALADQVVVAVERAEDASDRRVHRAGALRPSPILFQTILSSVTLNMVHLRQC